MLIVLDETIGISPTSFSSNDDTPYVIKIAKIKKRDQPFKEYIETQSSSYFSKTIKLSTYSLEEEIEFFSNLYNTYSKAGPIIYLYDPSYTHHPVIRRMQNIFQPDRRLYPIPAAVNRAETFFIINQLIRSQDMVASTEFTYQKLRQMIRSWTIHASGWVLTSHVKSIFKSRTLHKVYRKKQKERYRQVWIDPSGRLDSRQKGPLEAVWEDTIHQLGDKEIWVVTKGVSLPSWNDYPHHLYSLREDAFPVNIPYVQVFEPAQSIQK